MNETKPQAANLPRLMLVTQRQSMVPFAPALEAALQDGARLIQLREKDLEPHTLLIFAHSMRHMCQRFDAALIINGNSSVARQSHAQGVQLPVRALQSERDLLVGASVHSLDEARQAQALGADYLVLGSVFPTASHPEGATLELQVLEQIARIIEIPIFAIGGITARNARDCLEAGAHGVAVIRAAWDANQRRELLRIVGET